MVGVLWQLFLVNLISTFDVVMAPLRVAMTMGAVDTLPWWLVLIVASIAGAVGIMPLYFLAKWKIAHPWQRQVVVHPELARLHTRWRRHMFLWLLILCSIPYVDLVGTGLAGCERYPFRRMLAVLLLGRCIHNLPLVLGGLLLAKYAWFQSFTQTLRHPAIGLGLIVVLLASVVIVTRRIYKPQAVE